MNPSALSDVKVLEVTQGAAGAYCGRLLAGLGAEVIKVQKPGSGDRDAGREGLFLYLDANKLGASLNVETGEGKDLLQRLLRNVDVLIEDHLPLEAKKLGLDYEHLRTLKPDLLVTSITPFGRSGPYRDYRAYAINCAAAGGITMCVGEPGREPLAPPLDLGNYQSGVMAAAASLTALFYRDATGRGQHVDVSEAEVWATHHCGRTVHAFVFNQRQRARAGHRTPGFYPYAILPCKDGYVSLIAVLGKQWKRFLEIVGGGRVPDWYAREPRFEDRWKISTEYADEMDGLLAPWLMAHTKEEIFAVCQANHIPFAPVRDIEEVIDDDHLREREYFVEIERDGSGPVKYPGSPFRLPETPWRADRPAPSPGQDNDLVLGHLKVCSSPSRERTQERVRDASSAGLTESDGSGPRNVYPLAGIRVMDLGWAAAGPMLGTLLADMGAEVIKVESRTHWDTTRFTPDNVSRDPNKDPWFRCMNRNKMGVTINFSTPEGRDLFLRLAKVSDVIVENFSPRVLPSAGLDYDRLASVKPDLVMISLPALGSSGRMREVVTYGPSLNGIAGLDRMVGYCGERVLGMQQAYADASAAIHGAFAVLAALRFRKRTGKGQHIEMAQSEALIETLGDAVMGYTTAGHVPGTIGNRHPAMAPHNNYRCKGPDKWVSIAVRTDDEWQDMGRAVGAPDWAKDARFAARSGRLEWQEELDRLVTAWTLSVTAYEVMERLQKAGVAAVPCMDTEARYYDPHFQERQVFIPFSNPTTGVDIITNTCWRVSEPEVEIRRPAPSIGEHNRYVFVEVLGLPTAEIQRLEEARALY